MPYASTVFAYHYLSVFCTIVLTEMLPEERAKPPALSLACLQLLNAECFVWVRERREKNPGKFVVLIMGLSVLIKKKLLFVVYSSLLLINSSPSR